MAKQISKIKEPPTTSDPQNFDARADEFVACLPGFVTEANELAVEAESNANAAQNSKEAAANSAEQAGQARDAAALSAQNLATAVNDAIECKQSAAKSASSAKKSEAAVGEMSEAVKSAKSELENEIKQAKESIANDIEQAKILINSGNGGVIDDSRVSEVSTYSSKKLEADVLAQLQALEKKYEELKIFAQESNMAYDMLDLFEKTATLSNDEYSKVSSLRFMEDGNIAVLGQNFIKIYTPDLEEVAVPPLPSPQKSLQYIVMTIGEHPTIFAQGNQNYDVYRLIKNSEAYAWENIGRVDTGNDFVIGGNFSQVCNKFIYAKWSKDSSIWKYDSSWQKITDPRSSSQMLFDGVDYSRYGNLALYGKDKFYLVKNENQTLTYKEFDLKNLQERDAEVSISTDQYKEGRHKLFVVAPPTFAIYIYKDPYGRDGDAFLKNLKNNKTSIIQAPYVALTSIESRTSLLSDKEIYIIGKTNKNWLNSNTLEAGLIKLNPKILAKYGI